MSDKFLDKMSREQYEDYHRELFGKEIWDSALETFEKSKDIEVQNEK